MTPNEILNRQFGKVMGGYRIEDVSAFVAEVAAFVEELLEEKDILEQKMLVLADKLEEYREDEDSLRAALIGAQKLGDSVVRESRKKAELLIQDAQDKHDQIIAEARQKAEDMTADVKHTIERENDTLHKLQAEVARFKSQIKDMLYRHLEILNSIDIDEKALAASKQERQKSAAAEPAVHEPEQHEPDDIEEAGKEPDESTDADKKEFVIQIDDDINIPITIEDTGKKEPRHGRLMFGEDYEIKRKE